MAKIVNENAIVITGGPGAGKTAIIDALWQRGYRRMPESGRRIIQDQLAVGGDLLPWADRGGFAEAMFRMAMRDLGEVQQNNGITFFDRGLPDVIGYLTLCGLPVPEALWAAAEAHRYRGTVFIAPPWEGIYVTDRERKQDFGESVATYQAMLEVYGRLGYSLVEIPKLAVDERAAFIERQIRNTFA